MTESEEEFVHYSECIYSLNRAWIILEKLRETPEKGAIYFAAYRFALIEYAKPYKRSYGTDRMPKKRMMHTLHPPPSLPPGDLALHKQIMDLRDQVLAHSDLTLMEAKVHYGTYGGKGSAIYSRSLGGPFPDIDSVIRLTERTLDVMSALGGAPAGVCGGRRGTRRVHGCGSAARG